MKNAFVLVSVLFMSAHSFASLLGNCETDSRDCKFQIVAHHSGKCLDVSAASKAGGAGIIQFDCHKQKSANQIWTLKPNGEGYYSIVSEVSGKCLDVTGSSQAAIGLIQWDCHGSANQQFKVTQNTSETFLISARHSGKCLDIPESAKSNFMSLIQYPCHGKDNQAFTLVPVN